MGDSKSIEIQLSKTKLILMFLGCSLFVAIGICFIINPTKYASFIMKNTTIIFVAGFFGVLFFGIIAFFIFKKLGDKSPGLIISEEGVTDNSTGVSAGFIPWSDIIAIKETQIVNQKFINIVVKNPQVYIDRQKNAFKKRAMQINYDTYGIAIGISANALKIDYNRLKAMLESNFADFCFRCQ